MMGIELFTCSLVAWRENGSEVEVEFTLPTYRIRQNVIGQSGPLFRSWSARGKASSGLLEGGSGRVCLRMTSIIFTLGLSSHVDCISSSISPPPPPKRLHLIFCATSHRGINPIPFSQPNHFHGHPPHGDASSPLITSNHHILTIPSPPPTTPATTRLPT